jgi:hypothetical protein
MLFVFICVSVFICVRFMYDVGCGDGILLIGTWHEILYFVIRLQVLFFNLSWRNVCLARYTENNLSIQCHICAVYCLCNSRCLLSAVNEQQGQWLRENRKKHAWKIWSTNFLCIWFYGWRNIIWIASTLSCLQFCLFMKSESADILVQRSCSNCRSYVAPNETGTLLRTLSRQWFGKAWG